VDGRPIKVTVGDPVNDPIKLYPECRDIRAGTQPVQKRHLPNRRRVYARRRWRTGCGRTGRCAVAPKPDGSPSSVGPCAPVRRRQLRSVLGSCNHVGPQRSQPRGSPLGRR
jgi:hypothetical protein